VRLFNLVIAIGVAVGSTACTKKDAEVVNQKGSTLDDFRFASKSAAELVASSPASQPAAASAPASRPQAAARKGSTLDTFVFKPKSAAELAASAGGRK
jgi:hypothetical protein